MPFAVWNDTDIHFAKRRLSVSEKSTIVNVQGKALVMPGAPGTEIEELIAVGFNPALIYGLEEDEQTANALHMYYWDTSPIYCEEVGYWLSLARSKFSYLHLDYCGQITKDRIASIEHTMQRLAPTARLRMSVFGSRRGHNIRNFENDIIDATVLTLLEYIAHHYPHRAVEALDLHSVFLDREFQDPSSVICMVAFVNHVMGVHWHTIADTIANTTSLPTIRGEHQVQGIRRYRYVTDRSLMYTAWIDFTPISHGQFSSEESWLVEEILRYVRHLVDPAPEFVVLDDA